MYQALHSAECEGRSYFPAYFLFLFAIFACFHAWSIETGVECIKVFGIQLLLDASESFPEALEVYNFTGTEKADGVCDFRHIADYTEDIVIGRTGFLLWCESVGATLQVDLALKNSSGSQQEYRWCPNLSFRFG